MPGPGSSRACRVRQRLRRHGSRRGGLLESHLDAHVRQDARVQFIEPDAHFDGGPLAVRGGMMAITWAGDIPVGVGVQRGLNGLPGTDRG